MVHIYLTLTPTKFSALLNPRVQKSEIHIWKGNACHKTKISGTQPSFWPKGSPSLLTIKQIRRKWINNEKIEYIITDYWVGSAFVYVSSPTSLKMHHQRRQILILDIKLESECNDGRIGIRVWQCDRLQLETIILYERTDRRAFFTANSDRNAMRNILITNKRLTMAIQASAKALDGCAIDHQPVRENTFFSHFRFLSTLSVWRWSIRRHTPRISWSGRRLSIPVLNEEVTSLPCPPGYSPLFSVYRRLTSPPT